MTVGIERILLDTTPSMNAQASPMVGTPRTVLHVLDASDDEAGLRLADGFVFTSREGGAIRYRNFYRRHFRPAVLVARERAIANGRDDEAIPVDLRFHDLRHTCAAILIANGRHMEEVKEHLGYSSIQVTSDRYDHLFPSARQALAEGLEAVFQQASVDRSDSETDERRTKLRIVPSSSAEKGAIYAP